MTKLECPHCHSTLSIDDWNKELENSLQVGRADELIPIDIDADQWDSYRNIHGGTVDCPECHEVCVFDDMEAY